MANQRIDVSGGGAAAAEIARKAAEEAARKAAEEAARRAAEEAARKAAEEAARKTAELLRQIARSAKFTQSGFDAGGAKQPMQLDGGAAAPATNLLTENSRDGKANCLDRAADWLAKASPELRARSELVFLKDTRGGAEGRSGHVVIRQGNSIYDPSTGKSYADMEAFRKAQPQYVEVGSLRGTQAARIFAAPPGSAERARAIAQAKVPPALQRMLVADPSGTTGVAPTPRPLTAESMARAEADYARLAGMSPHGHWPEVARMLEANQHDPDYQAHLISLMKQNGHDSILFNVGATLFFSGAGGMSEELSGPRQTLLRALQAAREAGTFTAADLQQYEVWGPSPWGEVKQALGVTTVARADGVSAAMAELNAASGAYAIAKANAASRDEELAGQLAAFGPALTEDQRAAYIQAFQQHPDNKRIYDELSAATENLASVIERNEAALLNAAVTRPDTDGHAVNEALKQLADTPRAKLALEVAGRIVADPGSVLAQTFKSFPDFEKEVVQAAIPNAAVDILSELDNPEDGLKQLQDLLEPFKIAFADTSGGGKDIVEGLALIREATTKNGGGLRKLADAMDDSGWLKALGIAGVAFAGMAAVNAGREGDFFTTIKEVATFSSGGLDMVGEATKALATAGKFARFGPEAASTATRFASFATRLAPVLGLVASATSFGLRLGDLRDDPDAGKVIALLGDALGVLGAAVEIFPAGQPVGVLVSGIAACITALGEGLSWFLERGEFEAQRREFLEKAGVKEPLLQALLNADAEIVRNLVNDLELTPEQVQRLALQCPWLLEGVGSGASLDNFVRMAKTFGLEGDAAFRTLSVMASHTEVSQERAAVVLNNIAIHGGITQGPEGWLTFLGRLRSQLGPEYRATIITLERALLDAAAS